MKPVTMFEQQFHLSDLIATELRGELSDLQSAELENWLNRSEENRRFYERLRSDDYFQKELNSFRQTDSIALLEKTRTKIKSVNENVDSVSSFGSVRKLWRWFAAAAAVLLVAGAGVIFYTNTLRHLNFSRHPDARRDLADIAPGKNTATITLANGSTIVLSDAKTGVVVSAESLKYNDGSAVGTSSRGTEGSLGHAVEMTSVATPRGGTYQVTLPDGTKVWLNAASSLKFPGKFDGGVRKVELSGEGYFEVAKDKAHPFIVKTAKQEAEVLGTHFNINSYADEASTKTTLLEGSVRVVYAPRHPEGSAATKTEPFASSAQLNLLNSKDKRSLPAGRDDGISSNSVVLKPNQQSVLASNNQIKVTEVNTDDATDWIKGYFMFNSESLESILLRLGRWYNVSVIYDDPGLKSESFFGKVSRYDNISKALQLLERTGIVNFRVKGNVITVFRANHEITKRKP
jgi:ferric-dicitrate binding protein FerR (iron transport regulator)